MPTKKSFISVLLGFFIILLSLLEADFYFDQPLSLESPESQLVQAIEVVDGDTIRVRDAKTQEVFSVRYLGIDAPELEGPGYETCFSEQAKEKNAELVLDQTLLLEFDADRLDRFGRTLAHVYTVDEKAEKDVFVNRRLLQQGSARFYLDKQNTLGQDELAQAALEAQQQALGLWGSCGEQGACGIKGNVDRLGKKYYHLPGDQYYSQTTVNLLKEDQWLCSLEEAEAKNFHRALQ